MSNHGYPLDVMFDEPEEAKSEDASNPTTRANEKADYFRMHAELAAVFEGTRKFDAQVYPGLDPELAREIQRGIGKLDKARSPESPILPPDALASAAAILDFHSTHDLSTNNYHVHRRPGEVQAVRWLEGEQVDLFYERIQAHFDAAFNHYREEVRANEWKQDEASQAYLTALDALQVNISDRYLRPLIKQHNLFVLSTQSADELDILFLTDQILAIPVEELVGEASAPGGDSDDETETEISERDRAWFFKLFALRGMKEGIEQMCFFTFLQKAEDTFGDDW